MPSMSWKREDGGLEVTTGNGIHTLGPEFFDIEKRLMLDGRAVDTIQVGDLLIAISL